MAHQDRVGTEPQRDFAAVCQPSHGGPRSIQPDRQPQRSQRIEHLVDDDRRCECSLAGRTAGARPALQVQAFLVDRGGNGVGIDPDPACGIVADRIQDAGSCRGFDGGIPAQSRGFEQKVAVPKVDGQVGDGACRLEVVQAGAISAANRSRSLSCRSSGRTPVRAWGRHSASAVVRCSAKPDITEASGCDHGSELRIACKTAANRLEEGRATDAIGDPQARRQGCPRRCAHRARSHARQERGESARTWQSRHNAHGRILVAKVADRAEPVSAGRQAVPAPIPAQRRPSAADR